MKNPRKTTEAEAVRALSEMISPAMPAFTPHLLAQRAIVALCGELKIKADDLAAIKEGKARIVRYRKG
jgi:hypothetical protein